MKKSATKLILEELSSIKGEISGIKTTLAKHDKNFEFVEDQLQKVTADVISFREEFKEFRNENANAHDNFASSISRLEDEFASSKQFQKRLDARVTVLEKAA